MRSRWFSVRATEKQAANGAPICIRLGDLSGVFRVQCARRGVTVTEGVRELIASVLIDPERWVLKVSDADERIRVVLGPLKDEFKRWCASHGLGVAAAVRGLIAQSLEHRILNGESPDLSRLGQAACFESIESSAGQVVMGVQEQAHEPSRMRLRLKPSEVEAVSRLAEQRRVSPQRLATQILRAFLLKTAVYTQQETVEMGAVNLSLMRIGTNLNQIAKQLNAHAAGQSRSSDGAHADFESLNREVRQCLVQIDGHVKSCAHELAMSRERWRIEIKD